jgi:hypothetical protein
MSSCAWSLPALRLAEATQPTRGNEISVMAEVNFAQCAVAFLDILGVKDFIAAAEVNGSNESAQFHQLLDAINRQL